MNTITLLDANSLPENAEVLSIISSVAEDALPAGVRKAKQLVSRGYAVECIGVVEIEITTDVKVRHHGDGLNIYQVEGWTQKKFSPVHLEA